MTASDVAVYINATSSFSLKVRMEKIRRNRKWIAFSCYRHLGLGVEEKIRVRGRQGIFYRVEHKSKSADVEEVNVEKLGGGIKTPEIVTMRMICLGTFLIPSPDEKIWSERLEIIRF